MIPAAVGRGVRTNVRVLDMPGDHADPAGAGRRGPGLGVRGGHRGPRLRVRSRGDAHDLRLTGRDIQFPGEYCHLSFIQKLRTYICQYHVYMYVMT